MDVWCMLFYFNVCDARMMMVMMVVVLVWLLHSIACSWNLSFRHQTTIDNHSLPPPPPLPSQNFNCQKIIMYTNRHELSMSCKPTKTSFVNNTKPTSNVEMNQILVLMSAVCFFMYFMRERTMMKYLQQIWEMRKGSERARKILASLHKYCFDWEKSRW